MIKDCVKSAKEKFWDKHRDIEVARQYKNKLGDAVHRGNITINKASFARAPEMTYSLMMAQMEQVIGNLQLDESD